MAIKVTCTYCKKKYDYGKQCDCGERDKARAIAAKHYDMKVRRSELNKKYDDFYHSKEWEAMRDYIKDKYHGLCLHCLIADGLLVSDSIIVHHIEALKKRWDLRLVEENLITLCADCHNNPRVYDNIALCNSLRDVFEKEYR